MVITEFDTGERTDLALAVRSRHRQMAFDAELDRSGVERLAILKLNARTQFEDETFVSVGPPPFGRELRNNFEFGADIDELVAERGEDDAADKSAAERGIENIRVLGQPDTEGLRGGHFRTRDQSRPDDQACRHQASPIGPALTLPNARVHRRPLPFTGDTNTRSTRRPSILTTSKRHSPAEMRSASIGTRLRRAIK